MRTDVKNIVPNQIFERWQVILSIGSYSHSLKEESESVNNLISSKSHHEKTYEKEDSELVILLS